ncbi:hypothetical protein ABW19_dt0204009 [Dactylella cylindrospora]|nr:hypothetical protein ABW19_dt0204009 [Dactylella cylindrospora]
MNLDRRVPTLPEQDNPSKLFIANVWWWWVFLVRRVHGTIATQYPFLFFFFYHFLRPGQVVLGCGKCGCLKERTCEEAKKRKEDPACGPIVLNDIALYRLNAGRKEEFDLTGPSVDIHFLWTTQPRNKSRLLQMISLCFPYFLL